MQGAPAVGDAPDAGTPDGALAPDPTGAGTAHTLTGDIRVHEGVRSRYLSRAHDVLVCLPPGYDEDPERRYPVLYMHDGQNLFDDATAYTREWGVDETAQRLIEAGEIEPLIIVGISNAGELRLEEYTPTRDSSQPRGGGAERYGRMLIEELKPFVDATYRTLPGPADTGVGGSSLGGLVSLYLGLRYPSVFWKLAVISPSAWWNDGYAARRVRALSHKPPLRIWLSVGTDEAEHAVEDVEGVRDALLSRGWSEGADLHFEVVQGGRHEEAAWGSIVEPMLRWLFPPNQSGRRLAE